MDVKNYGWVNNKLSIKWDDDEVLTGFIKRKGCGCKGGCDGSRAGCKNCFRMCQPCTIRCKCHGSCRNPHNDGAKCTMCMVQASNVPGGQVNLTEELIEDNTVETDTEDDNDEIDDDEDTEGLLPIPTQDKDDTAWMPYIQ